MKTISNDEVISVVNDLIRTNYDRIKGYEKASEEIKDYAEAEIKGIYMQMADESRRNIGELKQYVALSGKEPADDSTAPGDIYRMWMDVKTALAGNDILATLQLCEYGEDKALQAYRDALQKEIQWPTDIQAIVKRQQQSIKASHDLIKRYRDEHAHAVK